MERSSSPPWTRHWDSARRSEYGAWVERRKAFTLPGYRSLADVGLDEEWTTPYHLAACSPDGPALLTYNFLDAPSAIAHRDDLRQSGLLPSMPFNRVLDLALSSAGLARSDLYVTHAFHLLPERRSATIPQRDLDLSFDAIARHELEGRRIIALGAVAAHLCRQHALAFTAVPHLSARGQSFAARAALLSAALTSQSA